MVPLKSKKNNNGYVNAASNSIGYECVPESLTLSGSFTFESSMYLVQKHVTLTHINYCP